MAGFMPASPVSSPAVTPQFVVQLIREIYGWHYVLLCSHLRFYHVPVIPENGIDEAHTPLLLVVLVYIHYPNSEINNVNLLSARLILRKIIQSQQSGDMGYTETR